MNSILGIGGVTIDRIGVVPRMPGWDEVEYLSRLDIQQGGMVATAMMAAARLGGQAEYLGGIGDDSEGRLVLDSFRRGGVGAERVKVFPGGHTPQSFVLVHDATGERTIIHHRGVQEKSSLEAGEIDLDGVGFLHLDGYWFDTALHAAREAKQRRITITIDPSSSLTRERAEVLFPLADYIIPSKKYAKRYTGEDDVCEAAGKLLKFGCRSVVITMGSEGCLVATPGGVEHVPAFKVDVVDTTGAGDAFHGAFIIALEAEKGLREAARFSSAVAALKCTRLGGQAGLPTIGEVEDFLASRS
jgi:sugar/nucleoside kinase (ribokinase family)